MRTRIMPGLMLPPGTKPLIQAVLESATGRDLDPTRVEYHNYTKPVGRGYNQTVTVRTATNLRTGEITVTETEGAIV